MQRFLSSSYKNLLAAFLLTTQFHPPSSACQPSIHILVTTHISLSSTLCKSYVHKVDEINASSMFSGHMQLAVEACEDECNNTFILVLTHHHVLASTCLRLTTTQISCTCNHLHENAFVDLKSGEARGRNPDVSAFTDIIQP